MDSSRLERLLGTQGAQSSSWRHVWSSICLRDTSMAAKEKQQQHARTRDVESGREDRASSRQISSEKTPTIRPFNQQKNMYMHTERHQRGELAQRREHVVVDLAERHVE